MERYTDEKHPEGVYEIVPPVQHQQPKPKRPLWRRIVRVFLTVAVVFMVWSTVRPVIHGMRRRCHGGHGKPIQEPMLAIPEKDMAPPIDLDMDHHFLDEVEVPYEHYNFPSDLRNFWIKQESFHGISRIQVTGNLIVHSCEKAENISAHFKFELSDPSLRSDLSVEPSEDGILFKLDPFSLIRETVNATIFLVIPKGKAADGGDYSLDELTISTISIPIWLKDTVTTNIDKATISSVSGSIANYGKAADDNALDITSLRVTAVSGSIVGEFPLNHALDLETTSGEITADIVSANLKEETGYLKTHSVSGQHKINFLGKLNPRPLYSSHNSVSGDVELTYPEDWQGGLKLTTTSGHIKVAGKGTKVEERNKGPVEKFWKVVKGEGLSKGSVTTVSGKIDVLIGKTEK
ncbi:hypothetical protein H072_11515 [Dactylellina haptotyla CBS 200.50]|uniref:Adhesin domain-containing protein n=1 Tax=Dactylellina haptotyla (strain CBS 200.50) TaxID=1284197 RepID=S8BIT1_DACHA|nr:hypothetical protein H072_11515 [Dactylellina haptotyla CBS 200.50]